MKPMTREEKIRWNNMTIEERRATMPHKRLNKFGEWLIRQDCSLEEVDTTTPEYKAALRMVMR